MISRALSIDSALCKALEKIDELNNVLMSDKEELIGDTAGIGSRINDLISCFQMVYDSGTGMDELSLSNLPTEMFSYLDAERSNPELYQVKKNETIDANGKVISDRISYLQRVSSIVESSINPSSTSSTSSSSSSSSAFTSVSSSEETAQIQNQAGKKRGR